MGTESLWVQDPKPGWCDAAKAVLFPGSGDSFLETITIKCEALSVAQLLFLAEGALLLGNPILYANESQSKSGGSEAG